MSTLESLAGILHQSDASLQSFSVRYRKKAWETKKDLNALKTENEMVGLYCVL